MPAVEGKEEERILAAAVAASLDAVVVFDEAGLVVEFNPAAEKALGYGRAEALGRSIVDLIVPDHLRKGPGLPKLVAGSPGVLIGSRVETEARTKAGAIFPAELAVTELEVDGRRLYAATLRNLGVKGTRQE